MKANLSVIIPTLNNVKGLKYLLNYFKDKPYKIVVVDNKKKNLGFAGGVNKGAKKIRTKWMLILNDDIEFYEDVSINRLIEFAEEKKLDAVSPILVNPNGEVENYGYKVLPYGKIKLVKSVGSVESANLNGLTAACLLVKTKVFRKLKGFDKSFFAYLEDVDFFLRLSASRRIAQDKSFDSAHQNKSFGIAYDVKVLHNHMMTTRTMGNFKARQDMINWWRLYFKHKDRFKFNFQFIAERLKNISGFLKVTFSSFSSFQRNVQR
ncbi:MAG: glycosyltransferase [Patescibacteria group bacterium]